jgi:hypothetical protein
MTGCRDGPWSPFPKGRKNYHQMPLQKSHSPRKIPVDPQRIRRVAFQSEISARLRHGKRLFRRRREAAADPEATSARNQQAPAQAEHLTRLPCAPSRQRGRLSTH